MKKKTIQTNVAVNDPYDARLRQTRLDSLVSYRSFSAMLVWSVFLILPKCLLLWLYNYA